MNSGLRVLRWARHNGHTVTWMAEMLGYSRQRLSDALNNNDISPALAEALFKQFCLRVMPTGELVQQDEDGRAVKSRPGRHNPTRKRGRAPGTGRGSGKSKFDSYLEAITQLLADGMSQKEIAKRYGTTKARP